MAETGLSSETIRRVKKLTNPEHFSQRTLLRLSNYVAGEHEVRILSFKEIQRFIKKRSIREVINKTHLSWATLWRIRNSKEQGTISWKTMYILTLYINENRGSK